MKKRVVIIGGVAGGMSAAARLRRLSEELDIIVLERSGYVSFANCGLPYYLGREIPDREDLLLQTPESLRERFRLDVRVRHEVRAIDPTSQTVTVQPLEGNQAAYSLPYDDLILSVGASPIKPASIPGIDLPGLFTLRNIEDTDALDQWIETHTPRRAVIAGGGFIGLEVAEQFHRRGMEVTVVDAAPHVLAPLDVEMARRVEAELRANSVRLFTEAPIKAFQSPDTTQTGNEAKPLAAWVEAGTNAPMAADVVLVGLGVRPDIPLAKAAKLKLGDRGGIWVNDQLQTSQPHIWAVGDAIEVHNPILESSSLIALGGPANRQGRLVANNIMGAQDRYEGTLGTATLRVFSLTVASTGANERQLRSANKPFEVVHLHPKHHAGYYPGAEAIHMKVLFEPETGRLLGAQAVGKAGVDKRIDVIATAIKGKLSIRDLAELELCYAPPIGSAKDPVNLAGMMGENILDDLLEQAQWHELEALEPASTLLIDVREGSELEGGTLPNSLHIPLGSLRDRLGELPKEKTIVVYCQSGQRSYFASRVLKQAGFQVKNLSGAYLTWKGAKSAAQ